MKTLKSLIIVLFVSLLAGACSKDDSQIGKVDVISAEYTSTTNYITTPTNDIVGVRAKTGTTVLFDASNNEPDLIANDETGKRCDLYIYSYNDRLEVNIDWFDYSKWDDRPKFVYSTFTGDIDKINDPSELPQNLLMNLEHQFNYSDKSLCCVFYPVLEYTTPYVDNGGDMSDYSQYKGKYKIGEPQFLLQLSEVKKYDHVFSSTNKVTFTDYKFRTKYFDYK